MSTARAPRTPYPPDLEDGAEPVADIGELVDATARSADWANTSARGLVVRRAEIRECRLTGAELAESEIGDALFDGCRLDLTGLRRTTLERVVFRDCEMAECDLYAATLVDVLFERCNLTGATLTGATLERVELRGCSLIGAAGLETLRGARMPLQDVVENGPAFAVALGIEIID
jgi:uncharacterized protein YjbI with pentapeptide repeats